jgi:hypothetical protein
VTAYPFRGFVREPRVHGVGGRWIETLDDLEYLDEGRRLAVLVPRGFVCDGASVPDFAWGALRVRRTPGLPEVLDAPALEALARELSPPELEKFREVLPFGILHDFLVRIGAAVSIDGVEREVPGRTWAALRSVEALRTRRGASRSAARRILLALLLPVPYWREKRVEWRPAAVVAAAAARQTGLRSPRIA